MMQNLLLEEGSLVQVESINLQGATYSKFQPQSHDFLDITNPKAVLENTLRNFSCLTTGDVIAINSNEKIYKLKLLVMETKPDKAVSITEHDMNMDFDAPLGYKEPKRQVQHEKQQKVKPTTVAMLEGWASAPSPALAIDWMERRKGWSPVLPQSSLEILKEEFPIMNLNLLLALKGRASLENTLLLKICLELRMTKFDLEVEQQDFVVVCLIWRTTKSCP
ncbi:hypothetical protein H8959_002043 [Pygathrix nigripes]